jgi:hypothetical protein
MTLVHQKSREDLANKRMGAFFSLGVALKLRHRSDNQFLHQANLPFLGITNRHCASTKAVSWDGKQSSIGSWRIPGIHDLPVGGTAANQPDVDMNVAASSIESQVQAQTLPMSEMGKSSAFTPLLMANRPRQSLASAKEAATLRQQVRRRPVQYPSVEPSVGETRGEHQETVRGSNVIQRIMSPEYRTTAPVPPNPSQLQYRSQHHFSITPKNQSSARSTADINLQEARGKLPKSAASAAYDQSFSRETSHNIEVGAESGTPALPGSSRPGNLPFSKQFSMRYPAQAMKGAISITSMLQSPGAAVGLFQGVRDHRLAARDGSLAILSPATTSLSFLLASPGFDPRGPKQHGVHGMTYTTNTVAGEKERRPSPLPRPANRQEPGPYLQNRLQGLRIETATVERIVERKVDTSVKQLQKTLGSEAQPRTETHPDPTIHDLINDEVIQRLMQRMHTLAQEDRFRMGKLR